MVYVHYMLANSANKQQERMMTSSLLWRNNDDVIMRSLWHHRYCGRITMMSSCTLASRDSTYNMSWERKPNHSMGALSFFPSLLQDSNGRRLFVNHRQRQVSLRRPSRIAAPPRSPSTTTGAAPTKLNNKKLGRPQNGGRDEGGCACVWWVWVWGCACVWWVSVHVCSRLN